MLDIIMGRRSVRKFKSEKLPDKIINEILKAGLLAPTSKNKKSVEFIVVDEHETLLKIMKCKNKGTIGLDTAPCAIVIISDSEKSDVWIENASIAAAYMQLQIEKFGLGSLWIQIRKRFNNVEDAETGVRKILGIPDNYGVVCILALGYKHEYNKPYNDGDIDMTRVHCGKF